MKRGLLVACVLAMASGCANQNSIYRTFDISKGESPMIDIRQRAVLVGPSKVTTEETTKDGKKTVQSEERRAVCAEPSPDAMASLAYELAVKGEVPDKVGGELAFAMNDSAAFTGIRTQSIQLLRDFGYRLCESYMSGAVSSAQYDLLMRRFQKNTVALLAIEQLTGTVKPPTVALTSSGRAEVTKSLAEQRALREKTGDQIADLEKQRDDLKKKRNDTKTADPKADTSQDDAQIASLEGKVTRLKEDMKVIDDAITDAKGVLVEGKTEVTISSDTGAARRSDEHLQKVADVVGEIVNNIVRADDGNQLCFSVLQSPDSRQKEFIDWCIKTLNTQADADGEYLIQSKNRIQEIRNRLAAPSANSYEKATLEEELKEHIKVIKEISSGSAIYSRKISLPSSVR